MSEEYQSKVLYTPEGGRLVAALSPELRHTTVDGARATGDRET